MISEKPMTWTVNKHTPGPWHAQPRSSKTLNWGVYDAAGMLIVAVDVHQCASAPLQLRRKADADLIATAPRMLDALQVLLEEFDEGAHGTGPDTRGIKLARVAVEVATRRTA